jgi:adenine C2-methylase RlmN of 23S rRNA A2503 and tRNA A37
MRNLNPDEIFDQVAMLNKQSIEHFDRPLSNIVYGYGRAHDELSQRDEGDC